MRYEIILPNWDENYYLRQLKKEFLHVMIVVFISKFTKV